MEKKAEQQELTLKKPSHVSYSQVNDFSRCPFLWYATRVVGIPQGFSSAAIRGIVVHAVVDRYTKFILDGNEHDVGKLKELLYIAIADSTVCPYSISDDDANTCLKLLVDSFYCGAFNFSETISSEFSFSFPFHTKNLIGRVDRIDITDESTIIVDYKTGYYFPDQAELVNNLEFCIYAYAILHTPSLETDSIIYKLHNLTSNKSVYVDCDIDIVMAKMDYVRSIVDAMDTYKEFKPNPGEPCMRYGGCFMGNHCAGEIIRKINMDNPLDNLDHLTDQDAITLIANLSKINSNLRKKLKGQIQTHGETGGVTLVPRKIMVQNAIAIRELVETFNLDPTLFMRIDPKKLHQTIALLRRRLGYERPDNMEFLLNTLDTMERNAYSYIEGAVDLKFTTEIEDEESA